MFESQRASFDLPMHTSLNHLSPKSKMLGPSMHTTDVKRPNHERGGTSVIGSEVQEYELADLERKEPGVTSALKNLRSPA